MINEKRAEIASKLLVGTVTGESITIASGGYTVSAVDVTKSGYTAIGLVSFSVGGSGSQHASVFRCNLTSSTSAVLGVKNTDSSSHTWTQTLQILYIKD